MASDKFAAVKSKLMGKGKSKRCSPWDSRRHRSQESW
jgi:hypothetical protein